MMTDVEMTDDEVAAQIVRADCFIEQLRRDHRNGYRSCEPCAPTLSVAGFAGSPRRLTRCRS
jgi:hypothetical protein